MAASADAQVLRNPDSVRQSFLFAMFGVMVLTLPVIAFALDMVGKWWILALVPVSLFLCYSALRLWTLRVILNEEGMHEPAPFRPTVVTPWSDMVRVRRLAFKGTMKMNFTTIQVEHRGKWKHRIVALNVSSGVPFADETVDGWIHDIREAKKKYESR